MLPRNEETTNKYCTSTQCRKTCKHSVKEGKLVCHSCGQQKFRTTNTSIPRKGSK